ncbi:hypothetical protein COLO4_07286 [Corchorus olitorius]|uniref:F-box domain-containing protein n=1 Tax=Corchorus olitorius TaxID=93759 RepID=A0A1R3KK87_9ROSI|nr:hypothetical protein COLO4_07286 [Corchorus olitorius]
MSDFVPQEVVFQILSHLPVETLINCTLVCKAWYALITSSSFINAHLAKTLAKPLISQPILTRRFTDSPKKEHYFLHLNHQSLDTCQAIKSPLKPRKNLYPRVVGTVHGLICLSDDLFGYTGRILLWNPLVRRSMELPTPNVTYKDVGPYTFILGFGFDAKKNDYKVVRLLYPQGDLGDRRVHWIAYEKNTSGGGRNWVVLFDMEDEKFRKMKIPQLVDSANPMNVFISVTRGVLTVCNYYSLVADDRYCDIWEKTQYGDVKSWTKLYTVGIDVLGRAGRVVGLTGNDELLIAADDHGGSETEMGGFSGFLSSFEVRSGNLVLYDPKSRQTNLVVQPQGVIDAFFAGEYIESLVFLNKESGATSYEGAKMEEKGKFRMILFNLDLLKLVISESEGSAKHVLGEDGSMMGSSSNIDADEEEEEDDLFGSTGLLKDVSENDSVYLPAAEIADVMLRIRIFPNQDKSCDAAYFAESN